MDFFARFIHQLRTLDPQGQPLEKASRLANHLERRIATPHQDGFDLVVTGNPEQDREFLAKWLEDAANAPPFLAPSWTRTFSEALAWLVRNNCDVNAKSVLLAPFAMHDEHLASIIRQHGISAGYEYIGRDRQKRML